MRNFAVLPVTNCIIFFSGRYHQKYLMPWPHIFLNGCLEFRMIKEMQVLPEDSDIQHEKDLLDRMDQLQCKADWEDREYMKFNEKYSDCAQKMFPLWGRLLWNKLSKRGGIGSEHFQPRANNLMKSKSPAEFEAENLSLP